MPASSTTRLPSLGPRGEGWVVIQVVLFGLVIVAGVAFRDAWAAEGRPVSTVAGAILGLGGLALAAKGLLDLRGALTALPRPKDDAELVETGVYRLVRHPVYGGLVLAAAGWALVTASLVALAAALVLLGFFRLKSGREETWLRERYPDYAAYAGRTRRMLPFLY